MSENKYEYNNLFGMVMAEFSNPTTVELPGLKEAFIRTMDSLNERERRVIELRLGILDGDRKTLEELGKQFKITRERVRQIEAKAFRKMQRPKALAHLDAFLKKPQTEKP